MFMSLLSLVLSTDCQEVINLAIGMNMDLIQPTIMSNLSSFDCCDVNYNPSISCTTDRVKEINWNGLKLNGTVNSSAVPSTLVTLRLNTNKLFGPLKELPSTLGSLDVLDNLFDGLLPVTTVNMTYFRVSRNGFNGSIQMIPNGLTVYSVYNNKLHGSLDSIPDTLQVLAVQNNYLNGTLPPFNALWNIGLANNFFTGELPVLSSLVTHLYCDNNNLSGVLPTIPFNIVHLVISNNFFYGSIIVKRPAILLINNNTITDLVIYDASVLTSCDVSKTPLLGKVSNYTICAKSNLYTLLNTTYTIISTSTIGINDSTTVIHSITVDSSPTSSHKSQIILITGKKRLVASTSTSTTIQATLLTHSVFSIHTTSLSIQSFTTSPIYFTIPPISYTVTYKHIHDYQITLKYLFIYPGYK